MNPIVLEAMLYISLILSTPALWWVFSAFGEILGQLFFPGKIVEITYEDDKGHVVTSRLSLDDDDELVKILLKVKDKHEVIQ